MFKKIALSVGMIVFVGAAAAGATGAFFSDNETSTGNTFTAGAIDLKVDSQSHYNHMVCVLPQQGPSTWQPEAGFVPGPNQYPATGSPCDGTWTLTDLGPTNKFFNFGDVKPGDQGEDTVSLHVDNNPAWACAYIKTTSNNENTLLQPEVNAGDTGTSSGELAQNINFFTWLDNSSATGTVPGDNIWQVGEPLLQSPVALSATIGATTTLTLADGGSGTALPGGSTSYIGLGWCAGGLTISTSTATWSCNGATMSNIAQTDSATADITFHVEQQRNNPNFRCQPSVTPVAPTTGSLTVIKVVAGNGAGSTTPANFQIHVANGVDVAGSPQPGSSVGTTFTGLLPATYTVSETGTSTPIGTILTTTFTGGCSVIGTTTTASVGVSAGATSTCTVTNTYTPT